jgi:signal transduction histidine kinase
MRVQDDTIRKMVERGLKSAARGEKLVQHLMAFARRKPLRAEVIEPVAILTDIVEMLTRSFITLDVNSQIADDLWPILVDQNQLESAILNLAINARDAMHERGRLTVEARNVHLQNGPDDQGLTGDFLALAVSDTGPGMSPDILEKVFEPFFTTKGVGVGTGLGLSMVYDFVTQSSGRAQIRSEIGKGTTITIYLPRATTVGSRSS